MTWPSRPPAVQRVSMFKFFGRLTAGTDGHAITLRTAEGVELIINRQYGQWGTEYHPERDR